MDYLASIDEGSFVGGHRIRGRRLNGDQDGQGRTVRLSQFGARSGSILRIRLYQKLSSAAN
jgi:hypothetical protein